MIYMSCNDELRIFAKTGNTLVQKDKQALESAQLIQRAFRNVATSLGPAVVSINATRITRRRSRSRRFYGDEFFRRFFRRQPRRRKSKALGSGFVIDKKGYILTNYHVIKGATSIKVVFSNSKEYDAKIIGKDKETDIALLKISAPKDIPVAPLGNSDEIQVGDWAIAIGNPFGLAGTFTTGIVSAKSRGDKIGAPYQNFIQVDTAINPGNSGGPLVNIKGEVVGINTMIYSRSGGFMGIGFAVPINIAKNITQSLIKKGHYERGYLGIYPGAIDKKMRKALKLPDSKGIIVNSVVEKSPAQKAGLKEGDIILKINKTIIRKVPQLMRVVAAFPIGKKVYIQIQRNWKKKTIILVMGKRPGEEKISRKNTNKKSYEKWLGLQVRPVSQVSQRFLQQYRINANERGIVIVKTSEEADDSGLREGDLILAINYRRITNLKGFRSFVKQHGKRSSFIFKIKRMGRTMFKAVNK